MTALRQEAGQASLAGRGNLLLDEPGLMDELHKLLGLH